MLFEERQRIVFIGDSITDCGRRGARAPYGNGYVNLVRAFVTAAHPQLHLEWRNRGVSGNTVRDLAARWRRDAIDAAPDWLTVKVGINDVWRFFTGRTREAVPFEEYRDTLRTLLRQVVDATGCRLVLMTPYLIEPDRQDAQRLLSDRYGAAVEEIAVEHGAVLVRSQAAFDRVLAHSVPTDWAKDRVHPNLAGHAVLARAYLAAVGVDG